MNQIWDNAAAAIDWPILGLLFLVLVLALVAGEIANKAQNSKVDNDKNVSFFDRWEDK